MPWFSCLVGLQGNRYVQSLEDSLKVHVKWHEAWFIEVAIIVCKYTQHM